MVKNLAWHAEVGNFLLDSSIEMQEAGEVAADWKPVATDIKEPDVTVNELSPRKDYNFRIRAELENGDVSDQTQPIQYHRSKVPPRLPIDKPDMVVMDPETVELSWRSASIPEAIRNSSNLTYTIEVRNPPTFEWRELISGLKVLHHTVTSLHNKIDYVFRVRAWNEYGCSEPSLPVSLYRPIDYNDFEYYDEDEEFEREWELRFGQQDEDEVPIEQVPPKLPIDTPKINTQTDTSIWFTWLPARIPAYATQTPISYVIELKEPPNTSWRRDVTGLVDCQYVREGLDKKRDYSIRVRAETEFGTSEPTLPIMIQRPRGRVREPAEGSRPGSRLSSVERDLNDVVVNTSFLDNLTSTGPPRMTSNRPQISDVTATSLFLSWAPSRIPSYVKTSGVSYIIGKREPPGHIWCAVARDVAETSYEILGMNPEQDYMFRVRAKNEHGISDPTLPVSVYRERDDYVPQKIRSRSGSRDSLSAYLSLRARRSSSVDFGSSSGGLKTPEEEFNDKMPRQPEYIETTYDTQYGVEGKKGKITLKVKGFPLPTVHWYFGEEKLQYGDQFNAFITPAGGITLELKNVTRDSVGEYKCYAENEHGASVKVVTFDLAEPPTVLEPLTDQVLLSYNDITLPCKVDGYPSPNIKWMKDWKPLAESARIKIKQAETEGFSIEITNGLVSDSGVYACVVETAAGKVTTACRLTVEDAASPREVILKSSPIEEFYTVLEEVRRGEHGVTRKVIEVSTGNSYEAQFIFMRNRAQKNFFLSEFEVLRTVNQLGGVLKIHDAFETERGLVFVTEPLPGVSLLEKMTADGNWTEADVAKVIKGLLNTLKKFEDLRVLYLDMKPSNIRLCGGDGKEVKLVNFAMSRIWDLDEDVTHNYGTVGYASPEQINNDVLSWKSDTWGIGVLTYVLLTGTTPFRGDSDVDILNKTAEGELNLGDQDFGKLSKNAQDFIQKLLVKQHSLRMPVEECMGHPWLNGAGAEKINMDNLKKLNNVEKTEAALKQVQTTAVLQSLSKTRHGTAALYQPAIDTNTGEIIFPDSDDYGNYLDEDAWYEWQLQYCDDPDSQNFPLMDKNFTVRESKHTAMKKDTEKEETEDPEGDGSIFFRNKIQPVTISIGDDVSFMCTIVSPNEKPIITWYRDETLLSEREAYRTEQLYSEETGIAQLIVQNAKDYDGAVYKCVARNKTGRVSCEARMLLGDKPGKPGRPVVIQTSGTEAFLTWSNPASDGNSYIMGYRVDYRKQGTTTLVKGPYVTEEYGLVAGLSPQTSYIFRVSCHNKYRTSPFSWGSISATTLNNDAPAITIAGYLQPLLQFSSFTKQQLILPAESRRPSLSVMPDAKVQKGNAADFYTMEETVSKGKYGEYKLCTNKSSNKKCVAKIMPFTKETHVAIKREFEILKGLRQLHIITVLDAYIMKEYCYVIFEHLSGLNIIQYLCLQKSYKEDVVARVVKQILDALQYLQTYGIAHLNLQPSSITMTTRRRPHIKLRDFTLARKLKDGKVENLTPAGYPDYVAPEVIKGHTVSYPADLWTLGALTFTLLSGVSPFGGSDLKETLSNILFDRYKASDMYDNVSKESIKFINRLLSRLPKNRPTVHKCLNSRWLQLSDNMLNSRQTRAFPTERLRDFMADYSVRRVDPGYMDIASVPVEELPKPTPGPIVQPLLSDKVTHRYEFKPKTTARIEREENEKRELSKSPVKTVAGEKLTEDPEQAIKPAETSILNAARKELEDIDKRMKPPVAKKPLKKQPSSEVPAAEPEIKQSEVGETNTAPEIKEEVQPVVEKEKAKESKTDEYVKEEVQPVVEKEEAKESKTDEYVKDEVQSVVEKKEAKESKTVKSIKDGDKIEQIKEEPSIKEEDSKPQMAETVESDNVVVDTQNIEEKLSEAKNENKNVTDIKISKEKEEIKDVSVKEEQTHKVNTEQTQEVNTEQTQEVNTEQTQEVNTVSDSKDETQEETQKQKEVPQEDEAKSEDGAKMDEQKKDVVTPNDEQTPATKTDNVAIPEESEQAPDATAPPVEEKDTADDSKSAGKDEIKEETVADSQQIETEVPKESTHELEACKPESIEAEPEPVEEESISPQVKNKEEAAVPAKEGEHKFNEEKVQELSDALNQLDEEVNAGKEEIVKEKSPEPVVEDEIASVKKDTVQCEPAFEPATKDVNPESGIVSSTEETGGESQQGVETVSSDNKTESSDKADNSEQTVGQSVTNNISVEKENIQSENVEQKEEGKINEVIEDPIKESIKEESRDSDDSEIHKLEQDTIPEKPVEAKEGEAKEQDVQVETQDVNTVETQEVSTVESKEEAKDISNKSETKSEGADKVVDELNIDMENGAWICSD